MTSNSDYFSGKSSVLESFSELPFPRDSGLCTRFATQITFRRAPRSTIKVSIIPGPDRNRQESVKLRGFVREGLDRFTSEIFLEILRDVSYMLQFSRSTHLIAMLTGLQSYGHSRARSETR